MSQEAKNGPQPTRQPQSHKRRLWRTFIRNKIAVIGLILAMLVTLAAIFADDWFIAFFQGREAMPLLVPFDPLKQDTRNRLAAPDSEHIMGLDTYGRDTWARIVYGARVSLMVGVCSVLLGGALGTFVGLIAGYLGGRVENTLMRAVDVLMAFPSLIMGMMVLAILGAGLPKMILAIGLVSSPAFARVAHGTTLTIKEKEYVAAAKAVGAGRFRIIRVHVLPNTLGELVVLASIWTATAIRVEANLSFIGLGVSPPTPAWGTMIREGTRHLSDAPWVSLFPGLAILVTVLAFNLLGDGLRDILDPRLQQ
ncbi:MAG: ABC transporter permease [Chloroflexota bacterium]|nr:ABC transporter permease [Chloroflexota bacterium]